jgi:hypothetical protein
LYKVKASPPLKYRSLFSRSPGGIKIIYILNSLDITLNYFSFLLFLNVDII